MSHHDQTNPTTNHADILPPPSSSSSSNKRVRSSPSQPINDRGGGGDVVASDSHEQQPDASSSASSGAGNQQDDGTRIPPLSLYAFIHGDLEPEGHRLLLPFLTTRNCLRLSECCRGLGKYRYHLSAVKLVPHPSPTTSSREGLARLLSGQKGATTANRGLEEIRVGDLSMVLVLEHLVWVGCLKGLKTLVLSEINLYHEHTAALVRMLSEGCLQDLEVIDLTDSCLHMGFDNVENIIRALAQGACPRLQSLILPQQQRIFMGCDELVNALDLGHCLQLRKLDLTRIATEMDRVFLAIRRGNCPDLRFLGLTGCDMTPEDGQELGLLLRHQACPQLEELWIGDNNGMRDGILPIIEAVGSCPHLQVLDMEGLVLDAAGGAALQQILSSGQCRLLRTLNLGDCLPHQDVSLGILKAIKEGLLPNLEVLGIKGAHLTPEHGRVLGQAIRAGFCKGLEMPGLSNNPSLGDEGLVAVLEAIEAGGCSKLKQLDMERVGMTSAGAAAVCQALSSGSLDRITDFYVGHNPAIGDQAMADILTALQSCRQLESFIAHGTGMGPLAGQALLQVLREEKWPKLLYLGLVDNPGLGDQVVGVQIVEMVESDKLSRLTSLAIAGSGMSRESGERLIAALMEGACPRLDHLVADCNLGIDWKGQLEPEGIMVELNIVDDGGGAADDDDDGDDYDSDYGIPYMYNYYDYGDNGDY